MKPEELFEGCVIAEKANPLNLLIFDRKGFGDTYAFNRPQGDGGMYRDYLSSDQLTRFFVVGRVCG
jgi:hypothetical protein